jgi:predicted RNase H-like nuclease (RuvC/YqgF family)
MAKKKPDRKKTTGKPIRGLARPGKGVVRHEAKPKAKAASKQAHTRHTPGSLTKVEEAQMFTDRTVERLNQEVLELHRQVEALARRLADVERRLAQANEPPPGANDDAD